ncbi:Universal minicircle sequence binding protein (UMSBP), partial [Phytophthora palmivora]
NESMETTADQRKCHNCGQVGHIRRDCPEAPSQEGGFGGYNSGAACFGCGKVGHLKRDCPTSAGGRACHDWPHPSRLPGGGTAAQVPQLRRDRPPPSGLPTGAARVTQVPPLRPDWPPSS